MQQPAIIDRGRGPEIAGTRITVYDVLDYHKHAWDPSRIALLFNVRTDQVLLAIRYIEEHRDAVMSEYAEMMERDARGNAPELQAKLDATHQRFLEMVRRRRAAANAIE